MPKTFHVILFFLLGFLVLLGAMIAPEASRLRYATYGALIPLGLATIFLRPLWGLMLILLIGGIYGPRINLRFFNFYLYHLLLLLSAFGLIIQTILCRSERGLDAPDKPDMSSFPVLALGPMIATLASLPMAENNTMAIKYCLYVGVLFCAYYTTLNALSSWSDVRLLVKALLLGATVTAVVGLLRGQFQFGETVTWTLNNPNAFGVFLVPIAIFWLTLTSQRFYVFRNTLFELLCLSTILLAGLLSLSRSSYLGFCGSFIFIMVILRQTRIVIFSSIVSIIILGFVYSSVIVGQDRLEDKMGAGGESGIVYRLQKIEIALDMFLESPLLGRGPGSFEHTAERMGLAHTSLESTYPYILAEYGLLGIIGWGMCFWCVYRYWCRLPRNRRDPRRILGNACIAFWCALLFIQIGENSLFFPKTNWLVGIITGLLAVLYYLPTVHSERVISPWQASYQEPSMTSFELDL